VLVQTRSSEEETLEFLVTAEATDFIAGVVGWTDLADPAIEDRLAALRSAPGGNYLVGIRHQVHDEPDPEWLLKPSVQRGLAAVGSAGLAYDLLVRTRELPAALETARRHPSVRFVVDHMAKPRVRVGARDPAWEAALEPLAALPNVSCKLSGLVTEADWSHWTPADLAPYFLRVLGWFGPERCLFGSDWPICLLAGSYAQVSAALDEALVGLAGADRERVKAGTACEVYRLG
jgi:L-fuconolactonase